MSQREYSVSEAVRLVGVESHVLRYWEEELQMEIRRTSQGYRVYSQQNIETFQRVRELKEHGLQLRAIRVLLDEAGGSAAKAELTEQIFEIGGRRKTAAKQEGADEPENGQEREKEPGNGQEREKEPGQEEEKETREPALREDGALMENGAAYGIALSETAGEKADQAEPFELILKRLFGEVLEEKNQKLEQAMRKALREEFGQFLIHYGSVLTEAAAAEETTPAREGILARVRRLLHR